MVILTKCPVCGGSKTRRVGGYFDTHLDKCSECALVFVNPQPTEEWIRSYYHNSAVFSETPTTPKWFGSPQERLMEQNHSDGFLRYNNGILDEIEKYAHKGKMLDVGCSAGTLLKLAKERGWDVLGIEIAREVADYARGKHNLKIITSDLLETNLESESFDCITVIHVLEHLRNPALYIREMFRLLTKGGVLYIRVPNLDSLKYKMAGRNYFLHVPEHLYWFSPKSICRVLEIQKLRLLGMYTQCVSNDPYFYYGIMKRMKIDSIIARILNYDKSKWKTDSREQEKQLSDNRHPGSGATYRKILRIVEILNALWPRNLIGKANLGDEMVLIAVKD